MEKVAKPKPDSSKGQTWRSILFPVEEDDGNRGGRVDSMTTAGDTEYVMVSIASPVQEEDYEFTSDGSLFSGDSGDDAAYGGYVKRWMEYGEEQLGSGDVQTVRVAGVDTFNSECLTILTGLKARRLNLVLVVDMMDEFLDMRVDVLVKTLQAYKTLGRLEDFCVCPVPALDAGSGHLEILSLTRITEAYCRHVYSLIQTTSVAPFIPVKQFVDLWVLATGSMHNIHAAIGRAALGKLSDA